MDAASTLRMESDSVIVLDPVNRAVIVKARADAVKDTSVAIALFLLCIWDLGVLFEKGWVEWITSMTSQAATAIVDIDHLETNTLQDGSMPTDNFGTPLAASLIPWPRAGFITPRPCCRINVGWKTERSFSRFFGLFPG